MAYIVDDDFIIQYTSRVVQRIVDSIIPTDVSLQEVLDKLSEVEAKVDAFNKRLDDISIPTNISQLNNDSGFITQSNIPTKLSEFDNDTNYKTNTEVIEELNNLKDELETEINSSISTVTNKIPTKTSQITNDSDYRSGAQVTAAITAAVPTKVSALTNDSNYQTATQVSESINSSLPTKLSQLTNDTGFTTNTGTVTSITVNDVTKEPINGVVSLGTLVSTVQRNGTNLNTSTAGVVNVTVPTKVSELTNDSNYQTSTQLNTAISNSITSAINAYY